MSVVKEGYKFRQDIQIPCYQTDGATLLRPSAFMDLAQEIAYWAAQALGFGYDTLHVHHTAWVLTRMHVHFENYPAWRDNVTLFTWHKGGSGLYYIRDFDLVSAQGAPLVSCTSSWVVINENTRRLVRPEELSHLLGVDYEVDDAIPAPAPKLTFPAGADSVLAAVHVVTDSDTDIVGHTNNAKYVVWALDCLPQGESRRPKDVYINFNKETTLGDKVELYLACQENERTVEGRVDGRVCFIVKLVF